MYQSVKCIGFNIIGMNCLTCSLGHPTNIQNDLKESERKEREIELIDYHKFKLANEFESNISYIEVFRIVQDCPIFSKLPLPLRKPGKKIILQFNSRSQIIIFCRKKTAIPNIVEGIFDLPMFCLVYNYASFIWLTPQIVPL